MQTAGPMDHASDQQRGHQAAAMVLELLDRELRVLALARGDRDAAAGWLESTTPAPLRKSKRFGDTCTDPRCWTRAMSIFTPLTRRRAPTSTRPLVHAASWGLLIGLLLSACEITIHDGAWGHDQEECYDEYGDCMDDAESPSEFAACESELDDCFDEFADDEADDGSEGVPGTSDDGDSEDSGDGDGDGDGDDDDVPPRADTYTDEDEGETSDPEPDCFEQYATCIGDAQTVQEADVCEVLFDHCIDPDGCGDPDCGCSLPQ